MKFCKSVSVLLVICIQGCSSLLPEMEFVPADTEAMNEWSMEGAMVIEDGDKTIETFFEYRQVDDQLAFQVKPDSPVSHPQAVIAGIEDEGNAEVTHTTNIGKNMAYELQKYFNIDHLSYWFRALPATEDAEIEQDDQHVEVITEAGWEIQYKDYMQVGNYYLPERMVMEKNDTEIEINFVRAETGYLTSPCEGVDTIKVAEDKNAANGASQSSALSQLVPMNGKPPLPRYINDVDFCRQLVKLHGEVPEPRIGLFGPNSMMWKVVSPVTPAGMGAGRALLLQTAHPWVTAGIDEHSIVRYDPLERARRTFIHIATMVYGSMPQVMESANTVHQIHNAIEGEMPYDAGVFKEHSEYKANEMAAMIWVAATLWDTIVRMYEEIEGPLSPDEKEQFYEETKLFAMLFGIPESALPKDWDEFVDYNESMWLSHQLTVTDNAKLLKEDLFNASIWLMFPLWVQEVVTSANLPPRIRDGYDMDYGLWEQMNYTWILFSAKVYHWMLPESMGMNPAYHEAQARLRGERVGGYQQSLIRAAGVERLVN